MTGVMWNLGSCGVVPGPEGRAVFARGRARLLLTLAGAACAAALAGCGGESSARLGPILRVSGSFNQWDRGTQAPQLTWDEDSARYRGTVTLPGDRVDLRLFSPRLGWFLGGRSPAGVPTWVAVPGAADTAPAETVPPLSVLAPLPTRYVLELDPESGRLRVDLAPDAEAGLPEDAALLVTALRGGDLLTGAEQAQRVQALATALRARDIETPLRVGSADPMGGTADTRGLSFLYLPPEPIEYPPPSLVGNWNGWMAGAETMGLSLGGRIAYLTRRTSGVRVEYRFDVHGQRTADPQNREVVWDGAYLPPNPSNLLGGSAGQWNSVAMAPGYVEKGSRLRLVPIPGSDQPCEVVAYLPPGYTPGPAGAPPMLPSLYVLDGKDALVRGRYDVLLDRLIRAGTLPPLVGVFVSSPADTTERLALFASDPDPGYPEVKPGAEALAGYLTDQVVPAIEARYTAGKRRALVGIDLAGAFALRLAWTDKKRSFARVVSQSGRFGWGDPKLVNSPYLQLVRAGMPSPALERASFDWSDFDQAQVQVHDLLRTALLPQPIGSRVLFNKQPVPTTQVWDNWRTQLESDLAYLYRDLVMP